MLCVFQGQQRNCLWENLKTAERKFPSSFSTAFIPACASYFLSSSVCFLLFYSYCSSITIVPSLLKRDIVHCGETSSLSSVTQEFPHRRKTQLEVYVANNTYFNVKIFYSQRMQNLTEKVCIEEEAHFLLKIYCVVCFIQEHQMTKAMCTVEVLSTKIIPIITRSVSFLFLPCPLHSLWCSKCDFNLASKLEPPITPSHFWGDTVEQ